MQVFSQANFMFRFTSRHPKILRYDLTSPRWMADPLKIAMITDLHTVRPWTTLDHLKGIAGMMMAEKPDLIVLGGDFLAGSYIPGPRHDAFETLEALSDLSAPLGVYGVLGNHDWLNCPEARRNRFEHTTVDDAFRASPFTLLSNKAVEMPGFWLVGFDSQCPADSRVDGFHDPEAAYRDVPEGAPVVLIAHEPDYFAEENDPAILQLSGHTHGGQINLGGWRPVVPSRYGKRYAYGHTEENGRHLVVSGGIGYSTVPLRVSQPPEITVVTLSST